MPLTLDDDSPFAVFSRILPYLYLTGAAGITESNIRRHKIRCVINTTVEVEYQKLSGVEYFRISLNDIPQENILKHLDTFTDKIEEVKRKGGNVVVHCFAGCSRSATVVIAYLMKYKNMTLRAAYRHVQAERNIIKPNPGFFDQLVKYEKRLHGTNSVRMVLLRGLDGYEIWIPDVYLE